MNSLQNMKIQATQGKAMRHYCSKHTSESRGWSKNVFLIQLNDTWLYCLNWDLTSSDWLLRFWMWDTARTMKDIVGQRILYWTKQKMIQCEDKLISHECTVGVTWMKTMVFMVMSEPVKPFEGFHTTIHPAAFACFCVCAPGLHVAQPFIPHFINCFLGRDLRFCLRAPP